jgi:excisionase family DNA binding protein
MSTARTSPYIDAEELANYFGTSSTTIRRWVREGRIPAAVAIGKVCRFDLEAVKAALAVEPRKQAIG